MVPSGVKRINYDIIILSLPRFARRRCGGVIITTILLIVLLIVCYFPWNGPNPRFIYECAADVNKRNALKLSQKRINVVTNQYYWKNKNLSSNIDHGLDHYDTEHLLHKSECVDMGTTEASKSLKICIYDPTKDLTVSRHLKEHGTWEKENIVEMVKAFEKYPRMTLVDLGSNVGAFTLQAAVRGVEVIAVDALLSNHILLSRSLTQNNLSCNVTLLHNAVHSRHPGQMMRIIVNPSNIGGSLISEIPDFRRKKIPRRHMVDTICLDDLVPLVRGKEIFLKMDLEGSEESALSCAHELFTHANVQVLLMEWTNYRHNARHSRSIKSFLASHHMVPAQGVDWDRTIDLEASHAWPDNVFWLTL